MEKINKFIIYKIDNTYELRIGYVYTHNDLLNKFDYWRDCCGGGLWDIDFTNKLIKLYGSSHEYGQPTFNELQLAINKFKYYNSLYNLIKNIYHKEDFNIYEFNFEF